MLVYDIDTLTCEIRMNMYFFSLFIQGPKWSIYRYVE